MGYHFQPPTRLQNPQEWRQRHARRSVPTPPRRAPRTHIVGAAVGGRAVAGGAVAAVLRRGADGPVPQGQQRGAAEVWDALWRVVGSSAQRAAPLGPTAESPGWIGRGRPHDLKHSDEYHLLLYRCYESPSVRVVCVHNVCKKRNVSLLGSCTT